jgi:hypothetical protein
VKRVIADKIASVAQHNDLTSELRLSDDIPCEEGVLVAVQVVSDKATYNKLELTSGRMAMVQRGDILVGALGHRRALFGYAGHIPDSLKPGDDLHLLNLGGVLGICDDVDPVHGAPFRCRVLGAVLTFPYLGERIGVPARIGEKSLDSVTTTSDLKGIPVIAVAGTCMDAGKTAAACAIVARFRHAGLRVDAFKATGVSARRDILAMEDAGARNTMIFADLGVVATTAVNGPHLTKAMLSELAKAEPDVIVFELGDGLLGEYGVEAILADEDIRSSISALVLSANDPVAAWGGVKLLREQFDLTPCVVTGPATDNVVGVQIIRDRLDLPAANALTSGSLLGDIVLEHCGKRTVGAEVSYR